MRRKPETILPLVRWIGCRGLRSVFWVGYHLALVVAIIVFLDLWWKARKWGIAFAILPDLDWIFIHEQEIFHIKIAFYRPPQ